MLFFFLNCFLNRSNTAELTSTERENLILLPNRQEIVVDLASREALNHAYRPISCPGCCYVRSTLPSLYSRQKKCIARKDGLCTESIMFLSNRCRATVFPNVSKYVCLRSQREMLLSVGCVHGRHKVLLSFPWSEETASVSTETGDTFELHRSSNRFTSSAGGVDRSQDSR